MSSGFESKPTLAPLADYLDSLAAMLDESDRTLLPAHGRTGGSLHARVDELLTHHEVRLGQTEADPFNQMLATTETLAHLQVLRAQDRVTETSEGALWRYA